MKIIPLPAVDKTEKDKRIFFLPVVFAAMGAIINVGSMAAIGYFSNERDLNDATRAASKAGVTRTALKHLRPAARVISKVGMAVSFLSRKDSLGSPPQGPCNIQVRIMLC